MNTPLWLQTCANRVLGQDPHLRRHVLLLLITLQPYAVSVGVILHSEHLKLLAPDVARELIAASAATFLTMFVLVRSGWSQRFADPVLTFPHALITIALCMAAYVQLGDNRGNVMILIAQTIVLSMFRLKPIQVLMLGVFTVITLGACVGWTAVMHDSHTHASSGWTHFVVGGSTLLTLSLIGKWVSDIRVRIGRQARELQEAVDTVKQMATSDMLTGALNRRMMTELAENELKLIERSGAPMCIALIDIDHFKHVNDHFGHHAGDAVLRSMAQHAQGQIRQVDKFSRWGGEEFLVMLPSISAVEGMNAIERLRQSVERLEIPGYPQLHVTFSAGVAQAKVGESLEQLIERADEALYEAKRQGRNRSLLAQTELKSSNASAASSSEAMS
ncbi:MAG TPA: GGDEF domain-containing protein [Aquabacterium sp.]|uniref:GGDEF domain-containing protein n=1 Tax=Aquabacterium sp. TaxID=1872578 RepID=UPI002E352840|nr:GGDEF domain-containing protein [Aquabacterium sp.]HEX5354765.1 GGDEF domain-containing protein [Aquabacterium sp.]